MLFLMFLIFSPQKLLGPLEIVPGCLMVANTRYPAISSLFWTLSTHCSAYFPPENDIFTYSKKKSSSGSPQKLLGLLEIVPGWPMVATITYLAISSLFQTHSTHFQPIFHPNMTFSTISKRKIWDFLVLMKNYVYNTVSLHGWRFLNGERVKSGISF